MERGKARQLEVPVRSRAHGFLFMAATFARRARREDEPDGGGAVGSPVATTAGFCMRVGALGKSNNTRAKGQRVSIPHSICSSRSSRLAS